jgi:Cd2+/Zn2+-exporting ATPase
MENERQPLKTSNEQNCSSHDCGCGGEDSHEGGEGKYLLVQLAVGALLLVTALLVSGGIKPYIFLASYAVLGWKVVYTALKNLFRGKFFDECFLMSAATGGAFAIGEFP